MSGQRKGSRGKPVRALAVLFGGWVLIRTALWTSPLALHVLPPQMLAQAGGEQQLAPAEATLSPEQRVQRRASEATRAVQPDWQLPAPPPALERPVIRTQISWLRTTQVGGEANAQPAGAVPARYIVGHTLLLAAGLSSMELYPGLVPYVDGGGPRTARIAEQPRPVFMRAAAERFVAETATGPSRWSMDGWLLLRDDASTPQLSTRPSYGRSQIGAVVRYRLAPSSRHAPQAYLRASAALAGAREQEGALGLSARPLANVPLRVAAEARLRQTDSGTDARAAAYAVSEFPPLALPAGTSGEAYVQGGYVTGRDATAFVDGQARITRDLASGERFRLSAGGGAWGGAQEGSERLDIGPSASLSINAGSLNARVSADYRFRVAGAAQPASGPALTISAGF